MEKISYNSRVKSKLAGYESLKAVLGTDGALSFLRLFDIGSGDYTKEKYEMPEPSREEIIASIMANRAKKAG